MARYNEGYLNQKEINYIQDNIAKLFTEESAKIVNINKKELKNEVDKIIQKVQLAKNKTIKRSTYEKEMLIAEGYLIVFKLREFLTQQEIDYRYYFEVDGKAKVIHFSEKNILNYMRFDPTSLGVSNARLTKALENQEYQKLLDSHYEKLKMGIQSVQAKRGSRQVVHSYIMQKYESINSGLRNQKTNRYQLFTMGHFFEAIDIAFSEAMSNNLINNYDYIESLVYGKYLKYDSVAGIKGGDNDITITQIKSGNASFLDYSTILDALKNISIILSGNITEGILKEHIKNLYFDQSKFEDINALNQAIEDALQIYLKID